MEYLVRVVLAGSPEVGKTTFSKAITGANIDELEKTESTLSKIIANLFVKKYENYIFHIYDPAGQLENISKDNLTAVNTYCELLKSLGDFILVGCVDATRLEESTKNLKNNWMNVFEKNGVKYTRLVIYVSKLHQQQERDIYDISNYLLNEFGEEVKIIIGDAYFKKEGYEWASEVYFSRDNYKTPHSYPDILKELITLKI